MVDQLLALLASIRRGQSTASGSLCLATVSELVLMDFGPALRQRGIHLHKAWSPLQSRAWNSESQSCCATC